MNILYLIIVILIAILLFVLFRDPYFRNGTKETFSNYDSGFGSNLRNLEHFITSNSDPNEVNAEHFYSASECPSKSIGIVIHKFKMNDNYNVDAIDDVVLTDYCSESYLEHNFINIINNIWNKLDRKFYLKQIVTEDEIENLMHYYVSDPKEVLVNRSRDPTYHCGTTVPSNIETLSVSGGLSSTLPRASNQTKRDYSENDVHLIQTLASLTHFELKEEYMKSKNLDNYKKVVRSLFIRMTNKDLYKTDGDIHIYLVPYIEVDNALIINGKDKCPLIVVSMYEKDQSCNRMKRTINDVTSPHTKGLWLNKFISNSNALTVLKTKINTLKYGHNDTITKLQGDEKTFMETQDTLKKTNFSSESPAEINHKIQSNSRKILDIYEYDYKNHPNIKRLKPYKTKNKLINGSSKSYNTLVEEEIEKIKATQKGTLTKLQNENDTLKTKLREYNANQVELDKVRKEILAEYNKADTNSNYQKIKTLEKLKHTKNIEINSVKYFAEKIKPIININLLLLCLFTTIDNSIDVPLKDINKDKTIVSLADVSILEGGLKIETIQKNTIKSTSVNKTNVIYSNNSNILSIININENEDEDEKGDKCNLELIKNTVDVTNKCRDSKDFETINLYEADDTIQYYQLKQINEPDMSSEQKDNIESLKMELKNKCDSNKDSSQSKIEPDYMLPTSGSSNDFWDYITAPATIPASIVNPLKTQAAERDKRHVDLGVNSDKSLNDLILENQNCNNDYLNSFSGSFI